MSETTNAAEESARIRAEFIVEGALAGMRLDAALAGALDAPRTRTSGWIRDGHVSVTNNGKAVKIGKSYKLSAGDEVVVDAPAPRDLADIRPEKVDGFRIVHLDEDIVVVDKPAGVAAHPSRAGLARPHRDLRAHGRGHFGCYLRRGRTPGHRAPPGRGHQRPDGRSPQ